MSKITLTDLANLQNENTAVGAVNANNTLIEQAIENTLSRDGTSPNQMEVSLDMNSNRVINLPAPVSNTEPVRLADLLDYNGGGLTVSPLPTGGTTNQILIKNSATNFDVTWSSTLTSVILTSATITSSTLSSVTLNTATLNSPTLVTPALGTPASGTLTNCTLPVTGVTGLGTGVATFLATPSSANLRGALTDETGTGAAVFANTPTLVTPNLGTPLSGTLTSCTGLPISTGVSGLGTGVATFLATPSSANLRAALTDEVGTGAAYFVGGALGTPASGTLTNCTGVVLPTASNVIGANVALNNTGSFFTGPSMAQGTSGTWLVNGYVTVNDTAGAATITARLWDGTTTIASGVGTIPAANGRVCIHLSGIISSPAGNIRIDVNDGTSTSGNILFNNSTFSKDSAIYGVRIA